MFPSTVTSIVYKANNVPLRRIRHEHHILGHVCAWCTEINREQISLAVLVSVYCKPQVFRPAFSLLARSELMMGWSGSWAISSSLSLNHPGNNCLVLVKDSAIMSLPLIVFWCWWRQHRLIPLSSPTLGVAPVGALERIPENPRSP